MKTCALLAVGAALAVGLPSPSRAADVLAEAAWARASAGPARNGAVYLTLVNRGADAALVGAETPASERVELHGHVMDGDTMGMRRLDAVALPAGGRVMLAPGGRHAMLLGLAAPLKEGRFLSVDPALRRRRFRSSSGWRWAASPRQRRPRSRRVAGHEVAPDFGRQSARR